MFDSRQLTLFRIGKLSGVGPATIWKIANSSTTIEERPDSLMQLHPFVGRALQISGSWEVACREADQDIEHCIKHNAHILSSSADSYPALLRQSPKAPYFLYVKGRVQNLNGGCVAVIGTRQPTTHGQEIAKRITTFISGAGWSVVSGLAIGCDSIAHKACVDLRAPTIAVLAHGLHTVAPKQNALLASQILDTGGTLVSEYSFTTEPSPKLFVQRDFLQALLAKAVVMIQSDDAGGSLHASGHSLKLGRILAVPFPTEQDQANKEKKIQANLILSSGDSERIAKLFGLKEINLDNIFVIRNRDDYPKLVEKILHQPTSNQNALFDFP